MTIRAFVLCFILFVLSFAAFGQDSVEALDAALKTDLAAGPCKNDDRLAAVKELFKKHGAADADIHVEKYKDTDDVVLTKAGKSAETIVIGAHYDKVKDGCGILDNWSGVVIVASLYEQLSKVETQKTIKFVAFGNEEIGLKGSDAMVKAIPKAERGNYCGIVNLDSFGLGYIVILENASSSKMIKVATDLGTELKVPVSPINVPGADADSSSFKNNGIPGITLSALSNKWPEYMHTSKDQLANILIPSVRIGYLYASEYLKKVEAAPCADYR
ncbi:MAG TPA: M20/M25/M40 family metallo-hydrolase [Pyrinomonadaceae bacterium]